MRLPQPWPVWLDDVWAKSAQKDEARGESLAEHTWHVLERMADLRVLRPQLDVELGVPNLWLRLYWTCLLHDLGKSATGFQDMLRNGNASAGARRWKGNRHEVISLAFVEWAFPSSNIALAEDRTWVIGGIASHHRDAGDVAERYPEENDEDITDILTAIPAATLAGIHRWLAECAAPWAQALGLPDGGITISGDDGGAASGIARLGTKRIRNCLRSYGRWVRDLRDQAAPTPAELLLRGMVTQSDHTASAHAGTIRPLRCDAAALQAVWMAESVRRNTPFSLYDHQRGSAIPGTALLVAPTGSGKTEAALLWAAAQAGAPRLFYTLPFQASMNAMFGRLEDSFGKQTVGLAHGRAMLALYRLISEEEEKPDPKRAEKQARRRKNLARLHHLPIQIFSPYQMLKAAYRLKGYEGMLADFQGASFIFDEIHAYEPGRLGLIIEMMRYLRDHHAAQFFVMSATFPTLIREKLTEALGSPALIEASPALYSDFCRHRVRLIAGDLFDPENWARIGDTARAGRSVLVCCNTVARAQDAQARIAAELPGATVVLMHGRLNGRDRLEREKLVRDAAGSNSQTRRPIVLVATQVVEVSLDIDLDTLFTDPAPLEALAQRFGRVNRRRRQPEPADVVVFRQPDDGQHIYPRALVRGTLALLDRENNQPVREDQIGTWLDEIYQGEARDAWLRDYARNAATFRDVLVRGLRPFQSDSAIEEQFYEAFDGIDVLPVCFVDENAALMETEPLRAQELFVSIRSYQLGQMLRAKRVVGGLQRFPIIVDVPYSPETGLDLSVLRQPPEAP